MLFHDINISAIFQSVGVSRSMLLEAGIGEGSILLNPDIGPFINDSTVMMYTAPLYSHTFGAS